MAHWSAEQGLACGLCRYQGQSLPTVGLDCNSGPGLQARLLPSAKLSGSACSPSPLPGDIAPAGSKGAGEG